MGQGFLENRQTRSTVPARELRGPVWLRARRYDRGECAAVLADPRRPGWARSYVRGLAESCGEILRYAGSHLIPQSYVRCTTYSAGMPENSYAPITKVIKRTRSSPELRDRSEGSPLRGAATRISARGALALVKKLENMIPIPRSAATKDLLVANSQVRFIHRGSEKRCSTIYLWLGRISDRIAPRRGVGKTGIAVRVC